tara:strand:- start:1048 stop:1884 length:837 start_codon:yes stop_codon:yes gene_type:complete
MLKRQHLPLMAKLNFKIDIDRLLKEFYEFGYNDWNKYDGLSYGTNTEDGLVVRRVLLEYFLNDEEKAERAGKLVAEGGEAYKMLCLTGFNGDPNAASKNLAKQLESSDLTPQQFARRMEKISDPNHPNYSPIADEKLYDKRNEFCKGYVAEVLDMIEKNIGHVARTRYAVLKAGEEIKPHIDINTDKAVRIHIPLITHEDVIIGTKGKKRTVETHMPADGSVWFLNQGYEHWVKNDSNVDRVHLVAVVTGQKGILESNEQYWDDKVEEIFDGCFIENH